VGEHLAPGNHRPWEEVRDRAESETERLGSILRNWAVRLGRIGRSMSTWKPAGTLLSETAAQGVHARHPPVLHEPGVWHLGGDSPPRPVTCCRFVSLAMKPVGKPDAGNPHVRFDERGWVNGTTPGVSTRAQPRLYRRCVRQTRESRVGHPEPAYPTASAFPVTNPAAPRYALIPRGFESAR